MATLLSILSISERVIDQERWLGVGYAASWRGGGVQLKRRLRGILTLAERSGLLPNQPRAEQIFSSF